MHKMYMIFKLQVYFVRVTSEYIYSQVESPCPEHGASYPSRILFAWFDALAWKGFRKPLEASDLWSMNPEDMSMEVVPKFDKYWDKNLRKTNE